MSDQPTATDNSAVIGCAEPQSPEARLTFAEFSAANLQRCQAPAGFNHPLISGDESVTGPAIPLLDIVDVVRRQTTQRARQTRPGIPAAQGFADRRRRREIAPDVFDEHGSDPVMPFEEPRVGMLQR